MAAEVSYRGNNRFRCVEQLGAGAFGTVFRAVDTTTNQHVALKLLERHRPDSLRRFKSEFRSLADVSHPNLVSLHELHADGGRLFFTMELVEGVAIDTHVWIPDDAAQGHPYPGGHSVMPTVGSRGISTPDADDAPHKASAPAEPELSVEALAERASLVERFFVSHERFTLDESIGPADVTPARINVTIGNVEDDSGSDRTADSEADATTDASGRYLQELQVHRSRDCKVPADQGESPVEDFERLRETMRQLAEGLSWLHAKDRLHRDLKPSNVMVEDTGRVVLLDFGLVTTLVEHGLDDSDRYGTVGTPAYMAPELCAGEPATPASDWYGFGAVLYKLLTGYPPLVGPVNTVLWNKQFVVPRSPRDVCFNVPEDLDTLCMELLSREPTERPDAISVLERLGADQERLAALPVSQTDTPFVGRADELDRLARGYTSALADRPARVFVSAPSGMGKSRLVDEFLRQIYQDGADDDAPRPPLALRSRCYERDGVPYKALDPAIDELCRHLRDRGNPVPLGDEDLDLASVLFPVMGGSPDRVRGGDPVRLRRRAHEAILRLFSELSQRRTVVLSIDDLQWADNDSLVLLREAFEDTQAPPIFLIGALRTGERSQLLPGVLPSPDTSLRSDDGQYVDEIELAPLPVDDADALARAVLKDPSEQALTAILSDAGGSPLFVEELAWRARRVAAQHDDDGKKAPIGALDDLIRERIETLQPSARQLLALVSVAGRPIGAEVVVAAMGNALRDTSALQQANLIRSRPRAGGTELTPFHDRVRESIVDALDPNETQRLHLELAKACLEVGMAESEFLAEHFRRGGDSGNAIIHTRRAAERAMDALAFDQAADLFQAVIDLGGNNPEELHRKRAQALRNAGRGPAAARAFLAAARASEGDAARNDEVAAAEQFLFSGAYDEGQGAIEQALASIGLRVQSSTVGTLSAFAFQSARVSLRGLDYQARDGDVPPAEQAMVDILWSATAGLSMANPIASQSFQKRHLRAALDSGSHFNVARALSVELAFSGLPGGQDERRSEMLSERAHAAAKHVDHPYAEAFVTMSDGGVKWLRGQWRLGLQFARKALDTYEDHCQGVTWESDTARFVELSGLIHTGSFADVERALPDLLTDARDRGDLYLETQLKTRCSTLVSLMHDEPARAREVSNDAIARWTPSGYHIVHFWQYAAEAQTLLYEGKPMDAVAHLKAGEKALRRSMLLMGQYYRALHLDILGRAAVGAAMAAMARSENPNPSLTIARRCARKLEREEMPWTTGLASVLRGGIALAEGKAVRARETLARAATELDKVDMVHRAHAARWIADRPPGAARAGTPSVNLEGAERAESWASTQGVVRPRAFIGSWLFGSH